MPKYKVLIGGKERTIDKEKFDSNYDDIVSVYPDAEIFASKDKIDGTLPLKNYKNALDQGYSFSIQEQKPIEEGITPDAITGESVKTEKQPEGVFTQSQIEEDLGEIKREDISKQAKEQAVSLKAKEEEAVKEVAKAEKKALGDSYYSMFGGMFGRLPISPRSVQEKEEVASTYAKAAEKAEETKELIEAAEDRGEGFIGNVRDFGKSLWGKVSKLGTWDFGISDLDKSIAIKEIADKAESGENLTHAEESLLNTYALEQAANQEFRDDLSRGYKAGEVTGESLPFMAEFLINPLTGTGKAIGKAATKSIIKRYGAQAAKSTVGKIARTASRVGGDVLGAAGMAATTGAVRTAADAMGRIQGQAIPVVDEDGYISYGGTTEGETPLKAIAKSYGAATIENFSEMMGSYFTPIASMAGKGGSRFLKSIGLKKVDDLIGNIKASDVAKTISTFNKKTGWSGSISEWGEEQAGTILNSILIGDQDLSELTDLDKQIDTFLGVSALGGFFSTVKTAGYAKGKYVSYRKLRNANSEAKAILGDKWEQIKESIDNSDDDQLISTLRDLVIEDPEVRGNVEAILTYAGRLKEYHGANLADLKKITEGDVPEDETKRSINYEEGYSLANADQEQKRNAYIEADNLLKNTDEEFQSSDDKIDITRKRADQGLDVTNELAYLNSQAKQDGLLQGINDKVEEAVSNQVDVINSNTHKDGNVYNFTMKNTGKEVHPINGDLVISGDRLDTKNSSNTIIIRDDQGNLEMISPSDLEETNFNVVNSQSLKSEVSERVRNEAIDSESIELDTPTQSEKESLVGSIQTGEEITLNVNGSPIGAVVQSVEPDGNMRIQFDQNVNVNGEEGRVVLLSSDQIKQMIIGKQEAEIKQEIEKSDEETPADVVQETPIVEEPTEDTQEIEEEFDDNNIHGTDIELVNNEVSELGDEADSFISDKINEITKSIEKAEKIKPKSTSLTKRKEEVKAKNETLDRLNNELEAWNNLVSFRKEQEEQKLKEEIHGEQEEVSDVVTDDDKASEERGQEPTAETEGVRVDKQEEQSAKPDRDSEAGERKDEEGVNGEVQGERVGGEVEPIGETVSTRKRIISDERADELRKQLKGKLNQLSAGIDPELFSIGVQLAVYHIENGAIKLADFSKNMIEDMGNGIKPYLEDLYSKAKDEIIKHDKEKDTAGSEGLFVDYHPERRERDVLKSDNFRPMHEEEDGYDPEDIITVYRGTVKGQKNIVSGDWVTPTKQLAKDYAGDGKIIQAKIQAKYLYAPKGEGVEELIYVRKSKPTVPYKIKEAEKQVDENPTEAQKEAGNYKKGHVSVNGFDITIENPKGSERKGVDKDGKEWSVKMNNTYGYIKKTKGKDGDHIDVFLGDNLESDKVFVIDQIDNNGEFDEHKVMMGFDSLDQAKKAYLSNYSKGWKGLGEITETDIDTFKDWINLSKKKIKPFNEYKMIIDSSEVKREKEDDNESNRFTPKYKLDSDNCVYYVRFTDHINEDFERGWSSWNFGEGGISTKEIEDAVERIHEGEDVELEISGFNLVFESGTSIDTYFVERPNGERRKHYTIGSGADIADIEELYDDYWVLVDNTNAEGGLSAHQISEEAISENNIKYISDVEKLINEDPTFDGTGDGEYFSPRKSRVVYEGVDKRGMKYSVIEDGEYGIADGASESSYGKSGIESEMHRIEQPSIRDLMDAFPEAKEEKDEDLTEKQKEMKSAAERIAKKLKAKVLFLPKPTLGENKDKIKGSYNKVTGTIKVYLENNNDVYDVEQTMLHEIVGHKGLREMFGIDFNDFLDKVYNGVGKEIRDEINYYSSKFGWDVRLSTEEYLARLAEEGVDIGTWNKIKGFFMEMLRKVGIRLSKTISDADLKYILWKSYHRLDILSEDIIRKAEEATLINNLYNAGILERHRTKEEEELSKKFYDQKLKTLSYKLREGYQDSMLSLKILQEEISKESKKPIMEFENAYTAENQMSSKSSYETEFFNDKFFKPIINEIGNLISKGASYEDIKAYAIAKHGLERNRQFAWRDSVEESKKTMEEFESLMEGYKLEESRIEQKKLTKEEEIDELEKLREKTFPSYKDFRKKDYSGLKQLTNSESYEQSAIDIVNKFEDKFDTTGLWDKTKKATRKTLETQLEGGLMSFNQYNKLSNMFKFYIPLRGWNEDVASDVYDYMNSSKTSFNAVVKKAKGRTSVADDPFATIGNMAESGILQANKNRMKQRFLNLALNHDTELVTVDKMWYINNGTEKDPKWERFFPDIPTDASREEIEEILQRFNDRMKELRDLGLARQRSGSLEINYKASKKEMSEHIVVVRSAGFEYVVYVNANPRAAQAINGTISSGEQGKIAKSVGWFNRQLASNFTTRNPAFVLSNMSRDVIFSTTAILVKEGAKYQAKYIKNIASNVKDIWLLMNKYKKGKLTDKDKDVYFKEFLENGGETGYTALHNIDHFKKQIKKEVNEIDGGVGSIKKGTRAFLNGVNFLNRCAEDVSRFTTYQTSRELGRSIERSISDAKEITVNFNKKGSGIMGADAFKLSYLFFNAAVQSLENASKLLKKNSGKMIAALGGFTTAGLLVPILNQAMLSMFGGDDDKDDYDNLPDWVRRNNLVLWMPFADKFITIPLPIELRAFYGLGEMAYQYNKGNMKEKNVAYEAIGQFTELLPLNPIGSDGDVIASLAPDAIKPFYQIMKNQDFFGVPIEKRYDFNKNMPEWTKAYSGTAPFLVKSSALLNEISGGNKYKRGVLNGYLTNPAYVEHLFESYFGGVGKTVNKTYKTISMIWNEDVRQIRNVPVVSSFVSGEDEKTQSRKVNEMYYNYKDKYEEIGQQLRGFTKEIEAGKEEFIKKLESLPEKDLEKYYIYSTFESEIKSLKKELSKTEDKELKQEIRDAIVLLKKNMISEIDEIK